MGKYIFKEEDVRQHLTMQHDIINRMSNNSSNCKTWLITIVAALIALQISQDTIHNYGWLMVFVCCMFWYLDAFYLALERLHRHNEDTFVSELNKDDSNISLFIFNFSTKQAGNGFFYTLKAMWSLSCFPFYLIPIVLIVVFILRGNNLFVLLNYVWKG